MVCKVTATRDSPHLAPFSLSLSLYDAKKGRQLGASHIRLSRIRPVCVRPCVCDENKNKSRTGSWKQNQNQAGRQAGAKNMLMSIILCVICFHASSAHPLWLPPAFSPLPLCPCTHSSWCYQYEYSYSYSHNVCANNFVSYFNRQGNHSTTYLISLPISLFLSVSCTCP